MSYTIEINSSSLQTFGGHCILVPGAYLILNDPPVFFSVAGSIKKSLRQHSRVPDLSTL